MCIPFKCEKSFSNNTLTYCSSLQLSHRNQFHKVSFIKLPPFILIFHSAIGTYSDNILVWILSVVHTSSPLRDRTTPQQLLCVLPNVAAHPFSHIHHYLVFKHCSYSCFHNLCPFRLALLIIYKSQTASKQVNLDSYKPQCPLSKLQSSCLAYLMLGQSHCWS